MWYGNPHSSNLQTCSKFSPSFSMDQKWYVLINAVTKRNTIIFSSNALVLKCESKTSNWEIAMNSDLEVTQTRIWLG